MTGRLRSVPGIRVGRSLKRETLRSAVIQTSIRMAWKVVAATTALPAPIKPSTEVIDSLEA